LLYTILGSALNATISCAMQKSIGSGTKHTLPGVPLHTKIISPGSGCALNHVLYVSSERYLIFSYTGYRFSFLTQFVAISLCPEGAVGTVFPRLSTTVKRTLGNGTFGHSFQMSNFISNRPQLLLDFCFQLVRLLEQIRKFRSQSSHFFFKRLTIIFLFLNPNITARR